jgi:hypothetical protein
MSDNGPNGWRYNGGMKGKKGWATEGGVRTPFFIRWEGVIPNNKKVDAIASGMDIMPTLLDLCHIEYKPEKPWDGMSLKPLLFDEKYVHADRMLVTYWDGWISTRSQRFRLDHEHKLYEIASDRAQEKDVSTQFPEETQQLVEFQEQWKKNVLSELPEKDERVFVIGHPDATYTQLPARDAIPYGNIKRSNKYPNSSYFMNWTATTDSIIWETEVLDSGNYEVEIFYNCSPDNIGSAIRLSFNNQRLDFTLTKPHTSDFIGVDDRTPRAESYEQN